MFALQIASNMTALSSSSTSSSINSSIQSLQKDFGDNNNNNNTNQWSSSSFTRGGGGDQHQQHLWRLIELLEKMRGEIFIHDYRSKKSEKNTKKNSKMKTMELKMKHLIAVSSKVNVRLNACKICLLYTSPSPRD